MVPETASSSWSIAGNLKIVCKREKIWAGEQTEMKSRSSQSWCRGHAQWPALILSCLITRLAFISLAMLLEQKTQDGYKRVCENPLPMLYVTRLGREREAYRWTLDWVNAFR